MSNAINLGAIIYDFLSTQNKIAAQVYRQAPEKEKPPQERQLQKAENKNKLNDILTEKERVVNV